MREGIYRTPTEVTHMRAGALTVLLLLLAAPLAGCAGSDGDVTVDLTPEEIQELMDANMDDFMDNMTVSINQNFYNNTSVDNHYNNTTTVDNSGTSTSSTTYNYNGTSSDPEIFVVRLEWDVSDMFPDITPKRENNFTVDYSYYDYATNDDRTDTFTLACSNYYDAQMPTNGTTGTTGTSYWQNNNYFWEWWDALYNNTIRDLFEEMAYSSEVQNACRDDDNRVINSNDYYLGNSEYDYSTAPVFFELDLPNGYALHVIQVKMTHSFSNNGNSHSSSSISWAVNNITESWTNQYDEYCPILQWEYSDDEGYCGEYFGGWADIHLAFQNVGNVYTDSIFTFTMYYELVPVVDAS